MKFKNIYKSVLLAMTVVMGLSVVSCNDDQGKYEPADGVPTVKYIKVTNPESGDSLITGAYLDNLICIVGDNLKSITEIWFNDQQAVLNTSYITEHTLLVSVPSIIPGEVNNTMRLVATGGTVNYPFEVIVPGPSMTSMSCEYATPGSEVTIYGNYFVDDPNVPFTIEVTDADGNPTGETITEFSDFQQMQVSFTLPASLTGNDYYFSATTVYGTAQSQFRYRDTRGMLFDFDGQTGLGNNGWHARTITSDETSITGNFVLLGDGTTQMEEYGGWHEDPYSFEYWCGDWSVPQKFEGTTARLNDIVDFSDFENMVVKFEMYVPESNPWSAGSLQVIFAGTDLVTGGGNNQGNGLNESGNAVPNNTYFRSVDDSGNEVNPGYPRALYTPWQAEGSFDTGGEWITVSLPIATAFVYDDNGVTATQQLTEDSFASLQLFVWSGGMTGTPCTPIIKIDNIRAVPNR